MKGFICILVFLKNNGLQKRNWGTLFYFSCNCKISRGLISLPWSTLLCFGPFGSSTTFLRFSYPAQSHWKLFLPLLPWSSTPPCWHIPQWKCLKWEWLRKNSEYNCKAGLEWRRHASHSFRKCLLGTNYMPGTLLGCTDKQNGQKSLFLGSLHSRIWGQGIKVPEGWDRREHGWCPMNHSMKPRRCSSSSMAPQPIDVHRPRLGHNGPGC